MHLGAGDVQGLRQEADGRLRDVAEGRLQIVQDRQQRPFPPLMAADDLRGLCLVPARRHCGVHLKVGRLIVPPALSCRCSAHERLPSIKLFSGAIEQIYQDRAPLGGNSTTIKPVSRPAGWPRRPGRSARGVIGSRRGTTRPIACDRIWLDDGDRAQMLGQAQRVGQLLRHDAGPAPGADMREQHDHRIGFERRIGMAARLGAGAGR